MSHVVDNIASFDGLTSGSINCHHFLHGSTGIAGAIECTSARPKTGPLSLAFFRGTSTAAAKVTCKKPDPAATGGVVGADLGLANLTGYHIAFWFFRETASTLSEDIVEIGLSKLRIGPAGYLFVETSGTNQTFGQGPFALADDTWYHVEMWIAFSSTTSGFVIVRVNGADYVNTNLGSDPSIPNWSSTVNEFSLGPGTQASNRTTYYMIDDLIYGASNDYYGPSHVVSTLPNANGTETSWTGTYTAVDEDPISGSDFCSTSTINNKETVNVQDHTATTPNITGGPDGVHAVKAIAWHQCNTAVVISRNIILRMNGVEYTSTASTYASTTNTPITLLRTENATGIHITYDDTDGAEVGMVHLQAQARQLNMNAARIEMAIRAVGTYTATAAVTTGAATATGSATFTGLTRTATAAVTTGPATASGSATFTAPVYTASAAVTIGPATATGSATFAPPAIGSAAVTVGAATASGAATFSPGTKTASADVAIGAATATGSATFAPGTKTATADVTIGAATAAGSATFVGPIAASAAVTVGAATVTGLATFAPGTKTATADVTIGAATAEGTGTVVNPAGVRVGNAAVTTGPATAVGLATFTPPIYVDAWVQPQHPPTPHDYFGGSSHLAFEPIVIVPPDFELTLPISRNPGLVLGIDRSPQLAIGLERNPGLVLDVERNPALSLSLDRNPQITLKTR